MIEVRQVILVVEDEPLIRLAAIDMVEDAGFEAVEAADGPEAFMILENRSDICIVFMDINMPPGIDGMTLAADIRDRWPPIGIILTSGHTAVADADLPRRDLFFSKPYREKDVVAAFRRMAA